MSIFGTILQKLGLRKPEPMATQAAPPPQQMPSGMVPPPAQTAPPPPPPPPKPVEMSEVDVEAMLERMAAANPQKLNWRTSIVDLMKLLGMESSLTERKQLATELGCPPDLMGDSAKMNIWLHKEVLRQISRNGGKVPKELLD
jgi:type IV secretory pathway VirB10-like protein